MDYTELDQPYNEYIKNTSMQLELNLLIKRCWLACKYVNTLYDGEMSLNQDQYSRR